MKVRPAVVTIENEHLLTMRYCYNGVDVFTFPGGNLEFGERMAEALKRELEEELCIQAEIGRLILIGETHRSKQDMLHCLFEGCITQGKPTLNSEETSALEIVWVPMDEIATKNFYPNVGMQLIQILSVTERQSSPIFYGEIKQIWY